MPLKQVYGKRSRRIYDPVAVFESSPEQTGKETHELNVAPVTKRSSNPDHQQDGRARSKISIRDALKELSINETVQAHLPKKNDRRARRRSKKRVVVEDNDVEKSERQPNATEKETAAKVQLPEYEAEGLIEFDAVPLFCDVEGYESEGEIVHEKEPSRSESRHGTLETELGQQNSPTRPADTGGLPPTPSEIDDYSYHCSKLLALSSHGMTIFSEWSDILSAHFHINKIAEASFSEVYRLSLLEQLPGFSSNDESVFKIIPLRSPEHTLPADKRKREAALKKTAMMSAPDDVANEVKLLQRMSTIPGFTNFRDVRVVKGRPPPAFAQAFKSWNTRQKARKKELSNFPDPAKKTSYAEDQLWAVIEMQDAGMDLEQLVESGECDSIWFIWDVFWQVVLSLAKGEEGAEFEHRDLHLGNICVRRPPSDDRPVLDAKRKLNFTGQETTIIDYTISRALMPDDSVAYHDLAADPGLFEADSTEEYQYDIYRYMRGTVLHDDPYADVSAEATKGAQSWQQYFPITNLIWLHFILYKLLEQLEWPSATKAPPRRQKEEHKVWKRANDLEHVLLRVQELLDPGVLCQNDLKAATDLVGLALREGWLDVEDVGVQEDESGLAEQFESLQVGGSV